MEPDLCRTACSERPRSKCLRLFHKMNSCSINKSNFIHILKQYALLQDLCFMMECTVEFCHPCLISLCLASGTEPSQPTTVLPVKTDLEASKISHIINSSMASVLLFLPSYIPTVSPPCSPYFCDTVLIPLTIRYVVLDINEFWSGGLLRCSVSLMQLKINILSAAWGLLFISFAERSINILELKCHRSSSC